MANFTRGQNFGSTEQVTNTKLHNLVENAVITEIVNNDISNSAAIDDLKLAAITRANKVSGTAIYNLGSLTSAAGYIPNYNLSLTTIPNQALMPLTLASWTSGKSLFNLTSLLCAAGQIPYSNIVPSLASGNYVQFNGSSLAGKDVTAMSQVNDAETSGVTYTNTSETTILSVAKTITSGKTVLLIANGYLTKSGNAHTTTIKLKNDSNIAQTIVLGTGDSGSWSSCAIVTGLSGSVTFSITGKADIDASTTIYGNLIVLEF